MTARKIITIDGCDADVIVAVGIARGLVHRAKNHMTDDEIDRQLREQARLHTLERRQLEQQQPQAPVTQNEPTPQAQP